MRMTQTAEVFDELDFLQNEVRQVGQAIEQVMASFLPFDDTKDQPLYDAMAYACLTGGKRLRPFLLCSVARLYNVPSGESLHAGAALEFIHCSSLIHDDLPCMDDSDLRRGQPSCHVQFSEAIALLAGDALISLAFEVLSHPNTHTSAEKRCVLMRMLSQVAGPRGIMQGQALDILGGNRTDTLEGLIDVHNLKTGSMIEFACEAGALLGGASSRDLKLFKKFGTKVGLIYQITDDLLDTVGYQDQMGKPVLQDIRLDKANFVTHLGLEGVRSYAADLRQEAVDILHQMGFKHSPLPHLIDLIRRRQN
jgi:farnesyl diphosphate synthase